ncbi:MAG: hypothetical protein J1E16_04185 [Muribaculaceae bacterium]|nr:hypothetical protein [Muribaculaceae bacterium]
MAKRNIAISTPIVKYQSNAGFLSEVKDALQYMGINFYNTSDYTQGLPEDALTKMGIVLAMVRAANSGILIFYSTKGDVYLMTSNYSSVADWIKLK